MFRPKLEAAYRRLLQFLKIRARRLPESTHNDEHLQENSALFYLLLGYCQYTGQRMPSLEELRKT